MKVLTILGTRPEIIRLCRIIQKLDSYCDHVIVHTGQNYDRNLNEVFFEELGVRTPDYFLDARGSFPQQLATIFSKLESIVEAEKPDRFLVLGDTNSSMGAIIMKRLGIPVYHMEAGNRCFDERVPEEVNRRIIDHSSDVLLPYTERSRKHLLSEGIPGERIYVTGNPVFEVINYFSTQISESKILETLKVQSKSFFLVTIHRQENVDVKSRLASLMNAFVDLWKNYDIPVIVSTHPRARKRLSEFGILPPSKGVRLLDPFGFFDFVHLEKNARCVLTDSGTVQEECAILKLPSVTIRDVTERPETLECGSNILSGADTSSVLRCVNIALSRDGKWDAPAEYLYPCVSDTVINIIMGFNLRHYQQSLN